MRKLWITLAVALAGCSGPMPESSPPRNIPVEVSYPIIRDEDEYNPLSKKRMVDVRLNTKVSKEVLREIALAVKSTEKRQYERTFIFYYLPGEDRPWATSHFNPTLQATTLDY